MAHPTDVVPGHIDEMLATYGDLQAQFERVRERLRRADDQKQTVARRIYERVRTEYERELDALRARMSPLRDELDRARAGLEAELRDTAAALEAAEEEMQEAEFRRRVGEFGDDGHEAVRQPLDQRVGALRARRDELTRSLAAMESARAPETPAPPAPAASPAAQASPANDPPVVPALETPEPPSAPAGESALESLERIGLAPATPAPVTARPVLRALRPAAEPVLNFENPQNWIDELGRDVSASEGRAPSPPAPASAPTTGTAGALATAPPVPRSGTPSLVFVNGPHAGQAMALLPTTLTIGREHDNNIEIKDADVARYHARVMHERGNWVVEDLDTPTGTWVNGQRTRRATLHHGDVIRVGTTELALDFDWTAGTN